MAEALFQSDPQVAEIASVFSQDAVDLALRNFGGTLDWSVGSIRQVEQILGRLDDELRDAHPPDDAIWTFAKAFGSYFGEVLRRNHGGEWGMVSMGEQTFPGLQQPGGALCWPWGRVRNRLVNGPGENVWHYYCVLVQDSA